MSRLVYSPAPGHSLSSSRLIVGTLVEGKFLVSYSSEKGLMWFSASPMAARDPLVRAAQYCMPADGLGHPAYATPGMLHGGAEEPISQYPMAQHPSFNQDVEATPPISSASQHGSEYHSHWQAQPGVGQSKALPSSMSIPSSVADNDSSSTMDAPGTNAESDTASSSLNHSSPGVITVGGRYQEVEEHLIPNGANWFMSVFM